MQDLQRNPERWNSLRIDVEKPQQRKRMLENKGDDGHNMVLATRLDDDGNPKIRKGYDADGRYTYVDNTTYKCVDCGVETGTTATAYHVECK